jgi:hypothetical protein
MAKRVYYVLDRGDGDGSRALGPYSKREARAVQVARFGSRVVTVEQLHQLRARVVLDAARRIAHNQSDPRIFRGTVSEFFERAAREVVRSGQGGVREGGV